MPADAQINLCRSLTGVEEISARHCSSVLRRARARFGDASIDSLLTRFGEGGTSAIFADAEIAGHARAIIYCLFTGVLPDAKGEELTAATPAPDLDDPEDYFEAVLWRVVQAHPPGLSGGYFGHWRYPPEDVHDFK
jgi:hypothetical protein